MAAKIRSSEGCWTCRLRRKKCDEGKPLCSACEALEIDCLYSDQKPDWMDGAEKQKEKADWLKAEVKRQASSRREKKYMDVLQNEMDDLEMADADREDSFADKRYAREDVQASTSTSTSMSTSTGSSTASNTPGAGFSSTTTSPPSSGDQGGDQQQRMWQKVGSFIVPNTGNPTSAAIATTLFEERELYMAMMYLDYVFPFLFPFYRPSFLDSGRGWLLVLLSRNKAIFHTTLSLASYFFAVAMDNDASANTTCRIHNAEELEKQNELALKELQNDMRVLIQRGYKDSLAETARVMACIVQVMISEVAVHSTHRNWQIHLSAASELFVEIMGNEAMAEHHTACWSALLGLLEHGNYGGHARPGRRPWNADQASLRFFTAAMLHADVVASTALEQVPRLQSWHNHLLKPVEGHGPEPQLELYEFVGIENWVLMAIGEISALATWKKEMKKAGSLSVAQLVSRAGVIEKGLLANMFRTSSEPKPRHPMGSLEALVQFHAHMASPPTPTQSQLDYIPTMVWALGALTYLNIVLSGWQPASPEIRNSVANTMELFSKMPTSACLRVVAWPFCVTGCLAAPDQEQAFRDLVQAMGALQIFGSVREALAIMENVWANRATIEQNPDSWDLSTCLNSLGHPSLLL